MPLSPEEIHTRASEAADPDGRLPAPPVHEWDIFPFEAEGDRVVVRRLRPPVESEAPRRGAGGVDCFNCAGDGDAIRLWEDERWKVTTPGEPGGLLSVWLVSREHLDFDEMDDDLAADYGRACAWLTRAMGSLAHVGRVHVCRWGDGSEHLHVWFIARPERLEQVLGSLAVEWDGILPPPDEATWRADLAAIAAAMAAHRGTAVITR